MFVIEGLVIVCDFFMQVFGGKPRFPMGPFPMRTEPQKLVRHCEVTAILVLYGLPR